MKAYIIYVKQDVRSVNSAVASKKQTKDLHGIDVELFAGTWKDDITIEDHKFLEHPVYDNYFGGQFGKNTLNVKAEIATFLSHSRLWQKCVDTNESILIFEDDVCWVRDFDISLAQNFEGDILNLGIPNWGTVGRQVMDKRSHGGILKRNKCTEHHDVMIGMENACKCDSVCLFGAHAYVISPIAARKLLDAVELGITPADVFIRNAIVDIHDSFPLPVRQCTIDGTIFSNIADYEA